jgi:hypothetical protein
MPTAYSATTGCYQCVRAGWLWCSAQWHYEEPSGTTYTTATEKGSCCYSSKIYADILAADNGVNLNLTSCPAVYSNAANTTPVEITSTLWWCSD